MRACGSLFVGRPSAIQWEKTDAIDLIAYDRTLTEFITPLKAFQTWRVNRLFAKDENGPVFFWQAELRTQFGRVLFGKVQKQPCTWRLESHSMADEPEFYKVLGAAVSATVRDLKGAEIAIHEQPMLALEIEPSAKYTRERIFMRFIEALVQSATSPP